MAHDRVRAVVRHSGHCVGAQAKGWTRMKELIWIGLMVAAPIVGAAIVIQAAAVVLGPLLGALAQ